MNKIIFLKWLTFTQYIKKKKNITNCNCKLQRTPWRASERPYKRGALKLKLYHGHQKSASEQANHVSLLQMLEDANTLEPVAACEQIKHSIA